MKNVNGIYLPDAEQHFSRASYLGQRYPVLEKALNFLNFDRRRTAVDVGAHVGLWAKWLVEEFDYVHAFEPVAEFAAIFPHNLNGSRNYRLHDIALGDGYRSVSMKVYPENTGQTHVDGKGDIVMLPLDYLDLKDVDLVKIDVEGYELAVLKGAQRTLQEYRPIVVIEERATAANNFAEPDGEARKFLEKIGMRVRDKVHYDYIMGW